MHKRLCTTAGIMALLAGLLCCSPASAGEVIEVGGTGSALGSVRLLGAAFEKSNPGVRVHVQPSIGSGGAVRAVSKGVLDVGLVSRALSDDEWGLDLSVIPYARTPFILVAWRNVAADGLSIEALERIYRGELLTWPKGERVRIVLRPENDVDTQLIRALSPGMDRAMDAARKRQGMLTALTDQDCIDIVEKTPGSLGFSTLAQVVSEKHAVKVLAVDGIEPTTERLATGRYPFAKTLSLVTRKAPAEKVRSFVDFILSPRGSKVLRDAGNLPVPKAAGR